MLRLAHADYKYISVRGHFMVLERSIYKGAQLVVFKPNAAVAANTRRSLPISPVCLANARRPQRTGVSEAIVRNACRIVVRCGAQRRFETLTQKTSELPVVVSWDRRPRFISAGS